MAQAQIDIQQIILDALDLANNAREEGRQIPMSPDALLFGSDGLLDSMELVGLLITIEEALLDEGFEVVLSDERAMSQTRSPFRSVQSLKAYIEELLGEPSS